MEPVVVIDGRPAVVWAAGTLWRASPKGFLVPTTPGEAARLCREALRAGREVLCDPLLLVFGGW